MNPSQNPIPAKTRSLARWSAQATRRGNYGYASSRPEHSSPQSAGFDSKAGFAMGSLQRLGRLPGGNFWVFAVTQAWAGLFGLLLLGAVWVTQSVTLPWFGRYDWLLIFAVMIQAIMLLARLQKPTELLIVAVFYLLGLGIEVFQTSSAVQAWAYPDSGSLVLGNAPLFAGFLYAAIGSYIFRLWRITRMEFTNYPRQRYAALLALAIYINFFTAHVLYDVSYLLLLAALILFWRTRASYVNNGKKRHMPFLLPVLIAPLLILLAEKFAAFAQLWVYTEEPNSLSKILTWLLLLLFSCIIVDLLRSHSGPSSTTR